MASPSNPRSPGFVDATRRLCERVRGGMRYDLQGIQELLAGLGNPAAHFDHVLLVGTNGKGSTAALLADSLSAAGHRVGRFTSPHLFDVSERICIDGVPIDDASLLAGLQRLGALEGALSRPYSFFEGIMAIAADHFRRCGVSVAVWEAGLGGRLDATNALPSERLRAVGVTPIGLDHQAILGTHLAAIAHEKAGVMRAGVPVVSAPQRLAALASLSDKARQTGAPLQVLAHDARVSGLSSPAAFLQRNAALADALADCLHQQGLHCPPQARLLARQRFCWPGRYQWIVGASSTGCGPAGWLIDAGHNPHGTAALAVAMKDDPRLQGRRLHVVFGALADKPAGDMLAPLRPQAFSLHLVPCDSPRSHSAEALQQLAPEATAWPSATAAIEHLSQTASGGDVCVVTGSLTLVAEALQRLAR